MVSKRRDRLEKYVDKEGMFIAKVQTVDNERHKLILNRVVAKESDGRCIKVADHIHVLHVKQYILDMLDPFDIITFRATGCLYTKQFDGQTITNFSLKSIRKVIVVEGIYYEK